MSMKKYFVLFCFSLVLFGFKKIEYTYYHSRLYPVKHLEPQRWKKAAHFDNIPISILLESRIDVEDRPSIYQGRFEHINIKTANLSFDKDIVILGNTFQSGSNLLETQYASVEIIKTTLNGQPIPDYYVLWINKENIADFYANKGYYTVYFKARTGNNYEINDSTVIYIK